MKLDWSELPKGLADIGRALVSKDLREPANIEALLDVVLWLAVISLALVYSIHNSGSSFLMFFMAFLFTVVSLVWLIFHYTVRRSKRRR